MNQYYKKYGLSHPAFMVVRRAGREIEKRAKMYFEGRLLDIGCGTKEKVHLVGGTVREYVGLDHIDCIHDKSFIDIFGTAYEIPQPDCSFDSILCTAVLEHLEEPLLALREAHRVLRPGGYALYTVPLFWHLHEEPRDYYRYTIYGLEYLLKKAGFEIVEVAPLAGFWLTFGSEWNYYVRSMIKFSRPLIVFNNVIFPLLDSLDLKFNKGSTSWTWLYVAVCRKRQGHE